MQAKLQLPKLLAGLSTLPRDAIFFLMASFVNSTGKAIMWPLTTIYVHNVMGKSYGEAGLVLLYQALFSVFGEFIGGNLYYRVGPKAMITGAFFVSASALFAIALTDSWTLYVILVCMLGVSNGISMPSMNAYVGFRWKEHRRQLYNVMYVCNNFGLSIGAMVGGLIASISFSLTYMLTGGTTLVFAIFLFYFMKESKASDLIDGSLDSKPKKAAPQVVMNRKQLLGNFRTYLFLAFGSMFFWLSFTQWSTGVAPYIDEKGLDLKYYSLLWTVNGVVILAGQPLTSWIKKRFAQDIVKQMVISAAFTVTAFSFVLIFHDYYFYLVIGMILATLGEMMLLPTIPTFFSERTGVYAPFYMGLAGGFANLGRMIGPLVFGHVFDWWGIAPVFLIGTLAALAALLMFFIHANLNKDSDQSAELKLSTSI
ncbi:arabinose ABC transporter permease [Paenibacillus sp. FSL H8-0548]|uniref:MFS transporter n=1 Tax=Paenibacillus sp. FSL H8-0548 TaxID=1920422 RepID=UPI00096D28A0|nr:MFS transporter [Paenibacillus sp. FSL H8-0548]OMF37756.1 arabinose ABC transporter permease [Paenibacillus sp. FSL H8-0548]